MLRSPLRRLACVATGATVYGSYMYTRPVLPVRELPTRPPLVLETLPLHTGFYVRSKYTARLFVMFSPVVLFRAVAKLLSSPWLLQYSNGLLLYVIVRSDWLVQKFCQWVSIDGRIPDDVRSVLSSLQHTCPEHSSAHTLDIVEKSLGGHIGEFFSSFPVHPTASGTIGQVYHCTLTQEYANRLQLIDVDGNLVTDVAVKIRHPLQTTSPCTLVDLYLWILSRTVIPSHETDGLKRLFFEQLSFVYEGHALQYFGSMDTTCSFPQTSPECIFDDMLIMSWFDGTPVTGIMCAQDRKHVADTLVQTVYDMTMTHRLLHSDLHPGNIMYNGTTVCIIDTGCTVQVDEWVIPGLSDISRGILLGDARRAVDGLRTITDMPDTEYMVYVDFIHQCNPTVTELIQYASYRGIKVRPEVVPIIAAINIVGDTRVQLDPESATFI